MSEGNYEEPVDALPLQTNYGTKRKRALRSKVWDHFQKLEQRDECMCNHCKRVFTCTNISGTSHLLRHIFQGRCEAYNNENEENAPPRLSYPSRSVERNNENVPWKFDQEGSWRDLSELIINWELPFNFVEDPSFQNYISGILPSYKFCSSKAMGTDCLRRYEVEKNLLKAFLQNVNPRVSITAEVWTSSQELPYLAVRVHFIDNSWKLHRKIIKFSMVPINANGEDIAGIIVSGLLEWNIQKICTITGDSCTKSDVVARILSEHCSPRGSLLLQGRAVQVRCWGNVLNFIVQEALDEITDSIRRVRNAVKYVKLSPKKKIELLQYADQELIPRDKMLVLDTHKQWSSTYKMLGSALHYRRAYDSMRSYDSLFLDPPTPEDWEKASIIHHFLENFFTATNTICGTDNCTANVFFREIYKILMLLRNTANDLGSLLGRMALNMLKKFEKYWLEKEPNILLSIAVVLDPRFKLKYLNFCFNKIYDSSLAGNLLSRVENELRHLFDEYVAEYEACSIEDNKNGIKDMFSGSGTSSEFMEEFYKFTEDDDIMQSKKELDVYLEEKLHRSKLPNEEADFDILEWWKANSSRFQVLSRMARDILAIPVSSVDSERAFSSDGRVLNAFRSSLLPCTVEALVCTQDWIGGKAIQNEFEEEMDMDFSSLTIPKDENTAAPVGLFGVPA